MYKMAIAMAATALLTGGLAAPQVANAAQPTPGAVRSVKIRTTADGCVHVRWQMPAVDSGDTFGVIIRTKNGTETHRIETYKMRTFMCDLKSDVYQVRVKQYGGDWVKGIARF